MDLTRREWLEVAGTVLPSAWYQATPGGDRIGRYPEVAALLRRVADDRARTLTSAGIELRAADATLAPRLDVPDVTRPQGASVVVPPDGLLTFAIDVKAPMWVRADLALDPDADVRPGLRATLLSDHTVVGAPMVDAAPWGIREITDPAPLVVGRVPPARLSVAPWLLPAGRRYITLAGPHMRPAGAFRSLRLYPLDRAVDTPLRTFAFISDTHVRVTGREDWMNRKMGEASAPAFLQTLHELARDGISFVMHGGDMTEHATRDEFVLMRNVLQAQELPVYGCIGNHDRYLETSRSDARDVLAAHFPGGTLDYAFTIGSLRFVVLDVAIEREELRAEQIAWLRTTLNADRSTPTVFVWHYPPLNRGGLSNCGFQLQDWSQLGRETVLDVLRGAPNVAVCLNGHDHWDEVNVVDGVPFVQNAAFVEWPNTFRVFRVYADRLEWEVRQVSNRGFVRESFLPAKAQSWMMATRDGDSSGVVPLRRG